MTEKQKAIAAALSITVSVLLKVFLESEQWGSYRLLPILAFSAVVVTLLWRRRNFVFVRAAVLLVACLINLIAIGAVEIQNEMDLAPLRLRGANP